MKLFKNTGGGACFVDEPYRGPSMTHGNAAAARVRLIVWCKECRHQVVEPDPSELATRYGAETPVPDWRERLVCSRCGGRQVDMAPSVISSPCRFSISCELFAPSEARSQVVQKAGANGRMIRWP